MTSKLLLCNSGPYRIIRRYGENAYELDIFGARFHVVNAKLLTQFYGDIPSHPVTPVLDVALTSEIDEILDSRLDAVGYVEFLGWFVTSARQLAKALEVPLVNDLGYTKRYVRCLQISEVVNSMKDLIDYSRETGTGPMASLINFPRRTNTTTGLHTQNQQPEEQQQQPVAQNPNNDQSSVQVNSMQMQIAASNGLPSVNNSLNTASTSTAASTIVGLLHQNSMNSRQENAMNSSTNSPYGGNGIQIPSAGSSSSLPQPQPNPSSPFSSPTPSMSNNPAVTHMNSANSPANISTQQPTQSNEADPNDSQSSVQQILQDLMMNGVGSMGNDMKSINGLSNGIANNNSGLSGFGSMGMGGIGSSATASGIRAAMGNNSMTLNGRSGISSMSQDLSMNNHQQQDLGNRLLSGLGAVNGFNNLPFDWKTSP
ncbi:hypothetical protein GIB67_029810 [Kingdonia uniflora]|uniref:Uncharacterized protein n=1 Tax=Kingdonia uniflora TaxID=39325 RepID=A0A7J7NJN9_9MAGN|nr:hypothetical protein GIB67_029810 [Kingdonia uniflora]